jgi:hypothetical protein
MPIVDNDKLEQALASKDKEAIKAALAGLSANALSKEEKAALNVATVESYLDTMNAFNAKYKAALQTALASLEKADKSIGKAEDKEQIAAIKKSF